MFLSLPSSINKSQFTWDGGRDGGGGEDINDVFFVCASQSSQCKICKAFVYTLQLNKYSQMWRTCIMNVESGL